MVHPALVSVLILALMDTLRTAVVAAVVVSAMAAGVAAFLEPGLILAPARRLDSRRTVDARALVRAAYLERAEVGDDCQKVNHSDPALVLAGTTAALVLLLPRR